MAVAILGLGLTAILSAQAGAFASAGHARQISVATGLLRCKMVELEEHLLRDGFQELDESESGICCEGDETPNMRCAWKIEKPQLPEAKFGELDLNASLGGSSGLGSLLGAPAGAPGAPGGPSESSPAGLPPGIEGAAVPDLGAAAGGLGGMASALMSLVYPNIKLLFEASIRRVTVTLTWREGNKEYSMDVMQWVTSPQRAGVTGVDTDSLNDPSGAGSGIGSGLGVGIGQPGGGSGRSNTGKVGN